MGLQVDLRQLDLTLHMLEGKSFSLGKDKLEELFTTKKRKLHEILEEDEELQLPNKKQKVLLEPVVTATTTTSVAQDYIAVQVPQAKPQLDLSSDLTLALVSAARRGDATHIHAILAHDKQLVNVAVCGNTPLMYAAFYGHDPVVLALLNHGADPTRANLSSMTALHWATLGQHPDTVAALISAGADANAADRRGQTALHLAARLGDVALVRTLLASGANVSLKTAAELDGTTVLHEAIQSGSVEVARLLVERGRANVNAKNDKGRTPLHRAVWRADVSLAKYLLDVGAQVDALDENERTPLHWAAFFGATHGELIALLLRHGSDMTRRDKLKLSAVQISRVKKFDNAVKIFEEFRTKKNANK
jgi:ankyrin repeat protein